MADNHIDKIAENARRAARATKDLANTLDKATTSWESFSKGISDSATKLEELGKDLVSAEAELSKAWSRNDAKRMQQAADSIRRLNGEMKDVDRTLRKMAWDKLSAGIDKIGRGMLELHATILTLGFDELYKAIKRVYELQERWTRALGAFNMKLGGMTAGMQGATKSAGQWESTMRGLTDQFGVGLDMFADFTLSFGKIIKVGDQATQQWSKLGLVLARGFNLGADSAGQLVQAFDNMGVNSKKASVLMSDVIDAANEAGVSTNQLAKDIADVNDYMVRFGKQGAKNFITAAGYARKFNISMKELQQATQKFDMFDEAATTAAKLNTVFGTAVNSLDLLLEDDPAKRFETIRQQLLAQGKTFDTLTPKQVRFLTETSGLTEKQVAAMLDLKNANVSYSDFAAKQQAKEKQEVEAKALMQKQLQKTAQTMYAFGAAFDRITVAIANAISPILKVFGLAGKGGKEFKSFGEVMESITQKVIGFFDSLAKSKTWTRFMEEIAKDIKLVGSAVGDMMSPENVAKTAKQIVPVIRHMYDFAKSGVKLLVEGMKKLEPVLMFVLKHSTQILKAWLAFKGLSMVGGMGMGLFKLAKAAPAISGSFGRGIAGVGGVGRGIAGAGIGAGLGYLTGGKTAGGTIGGGLGGLVGMMLGGPVGSAVGGALGGVIGRLVQKAFFDPKLNKAEEELKQAIKERKEVEEKLAQAQLRRQHMDEYFAVRRDHQSEVRQATEGQALRERLEELSRFGDHTKEAGALLADLQKNGQLTPKEFAQLNSISEKYYASLDKLDAQTEQQFAVADKKLKAQSNLALVDNQLTNAQAQLDSLHDEAEKARKGSFAGRNELDRLRLEQFMKGGFDTRFTEGRNKTARIHELEAQEKEYQKTREGSIDAETKMKTEIERLTKQRKQAELDMVNAEFAFRARANILQTQDAQYKAFRTANPFLNESKAQEMFIRTLASSSPYASAALQSFDIEKRMALPGLASGGIVTRPMKAIVGENGPEAVVPLKVMNRAGSRFGSEAVKKLTNFASKQSSSSGGQHVQVVAGDVYLDGAKVGHHIVRQVLTSRGG